MRESALDEMRRERATGRKSGTTGNEPLRTVVASPMKPRLAFALVLTCVALLGWLSLRSRGAEHQADGVRTDLAHASAQGDPDAELAPVSRGVHEEETNGRDLVAGKAPQIETNLPAARAAESADEPSTEEVIPTGEILVRLVGEDPAGVTVTIVAGYGRFMGFLDEEIDRQQSSLTSLSSRVGEARFAGLKPQSWSIGINSPTTQERWSYVTLKKGGPGALVLFEAGTSGVTGTVWDASGETIPGVVIQVGSSRPQTDPPVNQWTKTDLSGRYTLQGIPAGLGGVYAFHPWQKESMTPRERRAAQRGAEIGGSRVVFPKGDVVEVNFGSPGGLFACDVQVRNCLGDRLKSGSVQFVREDPNETCTAGIGTDGSATIEVPEGSWTINVSASDKRYIGVSMLQVVAGERSNTTVQLPDGNVIGGRIFKTDGSPLTAVATNQSVSLYTDERSRPGHSTKVAEDGTFVFHSVEPGTYLCKTWPRLHATVVSVVSPEGEPQRVAFDVVVK